jgi:hypothetical protein
MGNPETFEQEETMDSIWQQGVDQDRVNETAKSMLLARGPYTTTPPLTVSGQRFEAKEGKPARTILRAYGMVAWAGSDEPFHIVVNDEGQEVKLVADKLGRISFGFSPDQQTKPDKNGVMRLDLMSKLYVQVVKAYEKVYGQAPATDADLKTYLETYPVRMTIGTIGDVDAKNMVFSISPVLG